MNDDEKRKGKPAPPAFVRLLWRRPKRVPEPIPGRDLLPQGRAEHLPSSRTPFPADDRSVGYERGVAMSKEWDEATTRRRARRGGLRRRPHRRPRERARPRSTGSRVTRAASSSGRSAGPLAKDVEALYVDRQFAAAKDPETAVKRTVLLSLLSPRFLDREIGAEGPLDGRRQTCRSALWDSLPDDELRARRRAG